MFFDLSLFHFEYSEICLVQVTFTSFTSMQ